MKEILVFYVYILTSEVDKTHYYGHTKSLENRLKAHNLGKVRSTKGKLPWKIHYVEMYQSKSEAYKREMFFKSYPGYRYLKSKEII